MLPAAWSRLFNYETQWILCPNLLHPWLHLSGTVAAIILQPRKQSLRFIAEQIQIVLNFFVSSALSSPRILDAGCQKLETHIRNFTIAGKLLLVCKYTVPNRGRGSDAQGTSIKALLSAQRTHAKLCQLTQFILPEKLRVILSELMTAPFGRKDIFQIATTTRGQKNMSCAFSWFQEYFCQS